MDMIETIVLGIDLGQSTLGWSLLKYDDTNVLTKIIDAGTWTFSIPETDKDHKLTNQIRREARLARRNIRHRRQRLSEIRKLLVEHHILSENTPTCIADLQRKLKIPPGNYAWMACYVCLVLMNLPIVFITSPTIVGFNPIAKVEKKQKLEIHEQHLSPCKF